MTECAKCRCLPPEPTYRAWSGQSRRLRVVLCCYGGGGGGVRRPDAMRL